MAKIGEILAQVNSNALGVVRAADLLLKDMVAAGLVYSMDINPRQVLSSMANATSVNQPCGYDSPRPFPVLV
jgi:hypothetical protein